MALKAMDRSQQDPARPFSALHMEMILFVAREPK